MTRVAFSGVLFCACSYLVVGILGYSYVGETVQPNFLESFNYKEMSKPFFYLFSIFFAFPIMFFGCRNNFIAISSWSWSSRSRRSQLTGGRATTSSNRSEPTSGTSVTAKGRRRRVCTSLDTLCYFIR